MFQNFDPQTYSGTIYGSGGSLNTAGVGTVNLTGSNTFTGSTNLYNGNLKLSGPNGAIAGTSAINLNGGGLELVNATTQTGVEPRE